MSDLRTFKYLAAILFFMVANTVFGQTQWKPTTATISFKIKNAGFTVNGNFKGFTGQLSFDPNALAASSLHASVAVATISTGNSSRDNHLKKEEYFNAGTYPKIDIKSKSLFKKDSGYAGLFNVTIKDKTREVEIPFT